MKLKKVKQRKLASLLVLLGFLSYLPLATSSVYALEVSDLNSAMNGNVTGGGNRVNVNINENAGNGAVAQFDWNRFNVNPGQTVNFGFSGANQTSLNRVLGNNPSSILGNLTQSCTTGDCASHAGSGKVILINPAGMMFGSGSTVNLNSFTATTFDLKGAKNLGGMSSSELTAYANGFKPTLNSSGVVTKIANIVGEGAQFVRNGALTTKDGAAVTIEGSKWNTNNSLYGGAKAIGIAADNVSIKDSVLRTSLYYNYNSNPATSTDPSKNNQSFSSVRIVTADGVNFAYRINGAIKGDKANTTSASRNHNLTIDGRYTGKDDTITSGNVRITNAGTTASSKIDIKNGAVIRGVKLVNNSEGDVIITANNDLNVTGSRVETYNNPVTNADGKTTEGQKGGKVQLSAGRNATLTNSVVDTAYSTLANTVDGKTTTAGDVYVIAKGGNVTLNNSNIIAKGNLAVSATGGAITANDSVLQAKNHGALNTSAPKQLKLLADGNINLNNTFVESTSNMLLNTAADINVGNGSYIYTPATLSMFATDTGIANSHLVFGGDGVKFVDPDYPNVLNNVTISGSSTLTNGNFVFQDNAVPKKAGYVVASTKDLNVTTNGNLTIASNALKSEDISTSFDSDYNVTVTPKNNKNQSNIALTSTAGKVNVTGSNVTTAGNITINAKDTAKGEAIVNNSSTLTGANVTVNQALTFDSGRSVTTNSKLVASNGNVTINNNDGNKNADININYDHMNTLVHNNGNLVLNADRNNNIAGTTTGGMTLSKIVANAGNNNSIHYNTAATNGSSLNISNSKFTAANQNNIGTNGTLNITGDGVNPMFVANNNDFGALKDMNLTNLVIGPATAKTVLRAGDNLTATALDMNNTKLIADSNLGMNLTLKNVSNANAGVEINAASRDNGTQVPSIGAAGDVELRALTNTNVNVDALDNKLAISKIKSGNLTLHEEDQFIAAKTTITDAEKAGVTADVSGRGYIEVANFGGFNLDPLGSESFEGGTNPDSFVYEEGGHFVKRDEGYEQASGTERDVYQKHLIDFNNGDKFLLVYDKPTDECQTTAPETPDGDDFFGVDTIDMAVLKIPTQKVQAGAPGNINRGGMTDNALTSLAAARSIEVVDANENEEEKKKGNFEI